MVAWPNRPPDGAAAVVVAGAVVAAVPGVLVEAGVLNRFPVEAAAGVVEGAAEDVAPPSGGKSDFEVLAPDVAGAPNERGVVALEAGVLEPGNAGLAVESPVAAGALLKRDGVCACAPVAGAAWPKSGLGVVSAAVVEGVGSAGLFAAPNRPPLGAAIVVPPPNIVFGAAAPPPKRLPDGCDCEVEGVVDSGAAVEGVVEVAGFAAPKRVLGGLDAGGGPAGVVELLPNREPPAGAGVAVGAVLPKRSFVEPPPNCEPKVGVVDSAVLLGVEFPKIEPGCVPLPVGALAPKLKPAVPPLVAFEAPAFPKVGVLCPPAEFPPNNGDALLPVVEAPTFPKRPPLDVLLSFLAPKALPAVPKIFPLEAPVEAGAPKVNDMMLDERGQPSFGLGLMMKKLDRESTSNTEQESEPADWIKRSNNK